MKKKIIGSLDENKFFPSIVALGAGLYPLIFLYERNFTLVNSAEQLFFVLFGFLLLPVIFFNVIIWILNKIGKEQYGLFVIAALNVCTFLFLIKSILFFGLQKKMIVGIILFSFLFALYLKTYLKYVVRLQFILVIISLFNLFFVIKKSINVDTSWKSQPDDIVNVNFKQRPNIYLIQPDGYVGLSELSKGYYNFDNSSFEKFLNKEGFKLYPKFRSNYYSTLTSNTSTFMMKHHYCDGIINYELLNARNNIVSDNTVLSILKRNNYKTSLILDDPYLLYNRPDIGFDYCNISLEDVPYIRTSYSVKRDVFLDLKNTLQQDSSGINQFYFIENKLPSHITTFKPQSEGKDKERLKYLEALKQANEWLKKTINLIEEYDNNALIVVMADHGGFVGYDYSTQFSQKPKDRDITYSMFSSLLAIKWPSNSSKYDSDLKTSVNVFRVLFSYLSENKGFLDHLQNDNSYLFVDENAKKGVYAVVNENDQLTFDKVD
ncbi:MAG: hypothetical protein Wins2KO_11500 [Winogradskyella sp.]